MDAKLFFDPVSEELCSSISDPHSFFKNIHVYHEELPQLKGMQIALIGLTEDRGGLVPSAGAADEIRKKLYSLKKGHGEYRIIDLGNMRNGVNLEESYLRLKEICEFLVGKSILPVIVGGSHDMDYGQFMAYESLDKLVNLINVDAYLDIKDGDKPCHEHIEKILLHEPNYLFNYSHLAFQSYLINETALNGLEKLYFEAYRVGVIKNNITDMEPVVRDGDMLSFDMGSIRSSDAPGTARPQPFGLTGEEACQLCWYAGLNEKMSSVGIYDYYPENDDKSGKTASIAATMIWYFIEGFYHRKNEQGFRDNDYMKFVVSMPSEPEMIIFYKSKLSEKWWMEVPLPEENRKYTRNFIVPCRYEDYQTAQTGEVPDRYVTTHARLI